MGPTYRATLQLIICDWFTATEGKAGADRLTGVQAAMLDAAYTRNPEI